MEQSKCVSHAFFFFNDTATTEIYTLSLHDALPISCQAPSRAKPCVPCKSVLVLLAMVDRKSTRLNSSHQIISYAVFCLKKTSLAVPSPVILVTVPSFLHSALAPLPHHRPQTIMNST